MRLGVHVRLSGGLAKAVDHARSLGCETIQLFSSNPNSWQTRPTDPGIAERFRESITRYGIHPVTLHTPYLLNLSAMNDRIWELSRHNLAFALSRAYMLNAEYIVTHIGSHGGAGYEVGADRVAEAVSWAVKNSAGASKVLLEAGAGAGNTVGSTVEELAGILSRLQNVRERVGICLDTAHIYAAGYDISTKAGVDDLLSKFDQFIGLDRLRVFHLNDTQKPLGSHRDRHWHIGKGNIGLEGFRAIVNHPMLVNAAGIMETPDSELGKDVENLAVLKGIRD